MHEHAILIPRPPTLHGVGLATIARLLRRFNVIKLETYYFKVHDVRHKYKLIANALRSNKRLS